MAPTLRAECPVGFVQVQQLAHVHEKFKGEGELQNENKCN